MRIQCGQDKELGLYCLVVNGQVKVLDEREFISFWAQLQGFMVGWTRLSPEDLWLALFDLEGPTPD